MSKYFEINVNQLLREQKEDLEEGLFTQALKTAAINLVPGGRVAADFTSARGFEQLEDAAEQMENRLDAIEQRLSSLESLLRSASGPAPGPIPVSDVA